MIRRILFILLVAVAPAFAWGGESNEVAAAALLHLKLPVDVGLAGGCPDGGSTKGYLVDGDGTKYHFFIDHGMLTKTPGAWFVGADRNAGEATMLQANDPRRRAIVTLLFAWIDRTMTAGEQEEMLSMPARPNHESKALKAVMARDTATPREAEQAMVQDLRSVTQWFILKHFSRDGKQTP